MRERRLIMTLGEGSGFGAVSIFLFFFCTCPGASCELLVSPAASNRVNSTVGGNVTLAVSFSGAPDPAVVWFRGTLPVVTWTITSLTRPDVAESMREVVRLEANGSLTLVNVSLSYTGTYTVELTKSGMRKAVTNFTLDVFERPPGGPMCFVQSVDSSLRYGCRWPGGTPRANLSFPELDNMSFPELNQSRSGMENFSQTVPASSDLNGKPVMCLADHPAEPNKCSITAKRPLEFLPAVRSTVDSGAKILVVISCVSEASPKANVRWTKGTEELANGTNYQIGSDTPQLQIRDYNVSNLLRHNYTCTCSNPLGSQSREIQLLGPSISHSSLVRSKDGTRVTLTWGIPPTAVVTGFDIQLMGPDLNKSRGGGSKAYRTIQQEPGTARSANISSLDPHLTYSFRVVPKALRTEGAPSTAYKLTPIGNRPIIAGLAAGIPCSLLFLLLLLGGLVYLYVYCHKKKSRQPRYPVSRAVEKAITTQSVPPPSYQLTGALRSPPDYNKTQAPSERSVSLPTFIPPPPVRVATTV